MRVLLAITCFALVASQGAFFGMQPPAFALEDEADKDDKTKDAEEKVGAKPAGSSSELEDEMLFLSEEQAVTIVVTASKHGQKITEAPAAVTVISSEDIQASGAVSIADLFRRVPGLDFMQTSARDYNLNTRGFNNTLSRRLLVLVDGRSVYIDMMGFVAWDLIQVPLDDIERIEIVRGPGSALYGANASGGVVNIITKSPKGIDGTSVRLAYGEFATTDVAFVTGRAFDKFGYKVSLGYFQTDPFDNPFELANQSKLQTGEEPATKQPKGTVRLQYDISDDSRWVWDMGYAETTGLIYTGIGPLEVQDGGRTPFVRTSFSKGNFYMQAFWNALEVETVNLSSTQLNFFDTDTYDLELQYNFQAGSRNFFVVGGNVRYSAIKSDMVSQNEEELLYGAYVQDEIKLTDKLTANIAFRYDEDELTGGEIAPKAGLVFSPNPNHSIRATYSTAYNSSSFIEAYLDFLVKLPLPQGGTLDIQATGNPNLVSEEIESYELGYRAFPIPELLFDINVFHAKLTDFVQFTAVDWYDPAQTVPKEYSYINAGDATMDGVELSLEYYPTDNIAVFANYSYTDTEQPDEVTDVVANHKAGLTFQYRRTKGFNASLGVNYSSELEFPTSTAFYEAGTVDSFAVINGGVSWRFLEDGALSVGVRGTNLANDKHREFIAGDIIERKLLAEVAFRF